MAEITKQEIARMNVEELSDYLKRSDHVGEDIIQALKESRVDGTSFLELTDDDLRELDLRLGERKTLKRIIESFQPRKDTVRFSYMH